MGYGLGQLILVGLWITSSLSTAFSPLFSARPASQKLPPRRLKGVTNSNTWGMIPRGGDVESVDEGVMDLDLPPGQDGKIAKFGSSIMTSFLALGKFYTKYLESAPILTKSVTAGFIFGLSDYLAQKIEQKDKKQSMVGSRILAATLIGLLYFGPAAHYWYEMIFKLLPGTSLGSTLAKAFWGQVLFGPSFTCIFFGVSLLQSGTFSLPNWWQKIKSDLPGAWLAGAGYWPLVDLISYSLIPVMWIPLFVNMASLIWTIYLSIVANRASNKTS